MMTQSVSADCDSVTEMFHQNEAATELQYRLDLFFQRIFPPREDPPSEGPEIEEIGNMGPEMLYGSNKNPNRSSEQLLIEENLILRRVCSENALVIEQLRHQRDELNRRLEIFQLVNAQYHQTKAKLTRQISELKQRLEINSRSRRHLLAARKNKHRQRSLSSNSYLFQSRNLERKNKLPQNNVKKTFEENQIVNDCGEIADQGSELKMQGYFSIESSSNQELHCINLKNRPANFLGIYFDSTLQTGVVVKIIVPGSIAHQADMRVDDVIVEICGINVRNVNYALALKIMNDCHEDTVQFKLLRLRENSSLLNKSTSSEVNTLNSTSLQKTVSLRRREAFVNRRPNQRFYYGRQYAKNSLLYQNANITLSIPRKIHLQHSLERIQLLGGNAVGIFVHSITDENLINCLRTGDQLLEYNNVDLTQATAEDAAIELAKPARESVIVALFNLEGYNQIQKKSLGDSFYIRAEFSRASINRSLEFKKGEILYVDNTLHDGKPGYWRAWKVNEFGEKTAWGIIPSKYNAENEIQLAQQNFSRKKFHGFKFFTIFRSIRIYFRRPVSRLNSSHYGYHKLEKTDETHQNRKKRRSSSKDNERVLASFSMQENEIDCNNNQTPVRKNIEVSVNNFSIKADSNLSKNSRLSFCSDIGSAISYCRVRKVQLEAPRPVIVYGPFSDILVERLISKYPQIFRICKREFTVLSGTQRIHSSTQNRQASHASFPINTILESIQMGKHPVLDNFENCLEHFRSHKLFPIVIGLRFKSSRHIKDTVNQWMINDRPLSGRKISNNLAKSSFKYQKQLEAEWSESTHNFVMGNNHAFMCTRIKEIVQEEQAKVLWE